jgi:DNA modification methylase
MLLHSWHGDVVFDPFMGSGTTAVAAKKLGRHYFGCDISEEYVKLARERVAKIDGVQMPLSYTETED